MPETKRLAVILHSRGMFDCAPGFNNIVHDKVVGLQGWTPLHHASAAAPWPWNKAEAISESLLSGGADVNAQDPEVLTLPQLPVMMHVGCCKTSSHRTMSAMK